MTMNVEVDPLIPFFVLALCLRGFGCCVAAHSGHVIGAGLGEGRGAIFRRMAEAKGGGLASRRRIGGAAVADNAVGGIRRQRGNRVRSKWVRSKLAQERLVAL